MVAAGWGHFKKNQVELELGYSGTGFQLLARALYGVILDFAPRVQGWQTWKLPNYEITHLPNELKSCH